MSDLIGKIVCGYKIISEVGEGGMGKVYLAESAYLTEYKQQVAVKTLTPSVSSERQAALLRDLFTREANIQVQFKHPHIVSVIQFAVEEGQHFLILEYMPGYEHRKRRMTNVADVIRYETGPVPHKRALKLFAQALDAMSYAHNFKYRWEGEERVGIVHRDIKPANLLLLDPNTIKVSDFGIVKVQQRAPAATGKLTPGTSAYMAPEAILGSQAYGMEELDARSDIYALGVTLYEMLAGRLPFAPDPNTHPDVSLRRKHVNESPPPPSAYYPAIPKQLDELVLRALEKRPEARYQSAAEFKEAVLKLNSQLGLGLRDGATAREFETNPLSTPTEQLEHTTAGGATVHSTAGGGGRTYNPAATQAYDAQTATRATVSAPAR
ncbi:MAG: serine/threonine protein kinase, partial [Blastocatellia bacterium]